MARIRIYAKAPYTKADHILEFSSFAAVEALCPKDHACIVKICEGRKVQYTYLVSWLGDHYKWDPCHCESVR